MEFEVDYNDYDVVIVGTGLIESIVAGGLSRHLKVLHLEPGNIYGGDSSIHFPDSYNIVKGDQEEQIGEASNDSVSVGLGSEEEFIQDILKNKRRFNIERTPKLLYSDGDIIKLIQNGACPSLEFQLIKSLYLNGKRVPYSKEDIFSNKEISLIEKRRMMKLLTTAVEYGTISEDGSIQNFSAEDSELSFSDYLQSLGLKTELINIAYSAIALITTNDPISKKEGLERMQSHLKSIGVFGPGAFLASLYGTSSELVQAFCRYCAVHGGNYILNYPVERIKEIKHKNLICSSKYHEYFTMEKIASKKVHYVYCITKNNIGDSDNSIEVVPPGENEGNFILQLNSHTECVPEGYYLLVTFGKNVEILEKSITRLIHGYGMLWTNTVEIYDDKSVESINFVGGSEGLFCQDVVSRAKQIYDSICLEEFYPKKVYE
ncbi:hypothetical protein HDV06_000365 [Boothiomyces sp. JEL0866]|nr:hypothetical protein HDV06_000365 [Boothiomyces sp. JEL0866]